MKRILLVLLLGAAGARAMGRKPPEEKSRKMKDSSDLAVRDASPSEWRGQSCSENEAKAVIAADAEAWEKIWKSVGRPAPPVDFKKYFAAAVFLGLKNTGGFDVEFLDPVAQASRIQIPYRLREPAQSAFVIQAFTQPYGIKLYRKTGLDVSLVKEH